jgi:hypothetical protein
VTLLCAGVPGNINSISFKNNLKRLTITWTAPSNNGNSIQGYRVKRFLSTWTVQASVGAQVLSYSEDISYDVTYNYTVYAYNQVGEAFDSFNLPVSISQQATAENSTVVIPSVVRSGYEAQFMVELFDSGGNSVKNPSLMLLEVRDVCQVSNGFECIRVGKNQEYYQHDLLEHFHYLSLEDNQNASMTGTFTFELEGYYSVSVIQLQQNGVLVDFWDNIWNIDPIDSEKVFENFKFSYEDDALITTYSTEYVSLKLFSFLYVTSEGNYTFYVNADDYFNFYINGVMVYTANVCCQEFVFSYEFPFPDYYFIQIEVIQLDSESSFSLEWSCNTFNRSSIPTSSLFWPKRVSSSPWIQSVSIGLSSVTDSYFEGATELISGELSLFLFYSANKYNELLENTDDIFAIELIGPANYYFTSTYDHSGQSFAYIQAGVAGNYEGRVLLYGNHISGSPFNLTVLEGYPSILHSFVETFENVTVGQVNSFKVHLLDQFANPTSGGQVTMNAIWLDSDKYQSPIGVPDANQSEFRWNHSGIFYTDHLRFSVFIAGNYEAQVFLDKSLIQSFFFEALPEKVHPSHFVGVFEQVQVEAGMEFKFQVQTRDVYHNNLVIETLENYTVVAIGNEEVLGSLIVEAGVLRVSFLPVIVGDYVIYLNVSGVVVDELKDFEVIHSNFSFLTSSVSAVTSTTAGSLVKVYIDTKDDYGNTLSGGMIFTFTIKGKITLSGEMIDYSNGTYILIFTPLVVDSYVVTVKYEDTLVGSDKTIVVTNSNVRGIYSTLNSVTSVVAGKGTLVITSRDLGGNLVSNPVNSIFMGSQYYYVNITGNQNLTIRATNTDLTAFRINLAQLTIAGTYSVTLALMEEKGLNGFYYRNNNFQGLYKNFDYNNHLSYTPVNYTTKDSLIDFSSFNSSYPDFFSARWSGQLLPDSSGLYTFYLETDYKARFWIESNKLIDSISGSTFSGSTQLTGKIYYNITIEYKNGGENRFLSLKWSSQSISKSPIPSSVLFCETLSEAGPYSLRVTPDVTVARMCYTSQYPGDSDVMTRAYVRTQKFFNVYSRDTNGNQVTTTSDVYVGTLTLGTTTVSISFTNESGGKYRGAFTANTPGTYTFRVSLLVSNVQTLVNLTYVNVLTGPTDSSRTSIVDSPSTVVVGVESGFLVIARDSAGSQQIKGGDVVRVTMTSTGYTVPSDQILVTDNDDGSYSVKFITYVTGSFTTIVLVNSVQGGSLVITATSSSLSLAKSTISVPEPKTLGSLVTSDIYLKDQYSNPFTQSSQVFVFVTKETNSNFKILKFTVVAQDLSKGYYKATANYTLANVDRSGTCAGDNITSFCNFVGSLTLWSGIFDGKLLGKYYSNYDWVGTESYSAREANVSFSWDTKAYNIDLNAFSASWQGFLRPASAKNYTLYLNTDGIGEVFVDGVSVVNDKTTSASLISGTNDYFSLLITFKNNDTAASVSFEWMDSSRTVVPSNVLFYYLNQMYISDTLISFITELPAVSN